MGYFLINPFRRLIDSPKKILGPFIKPGMTVLDVGCGMGYYNESIMGFGFWGRIEMYNWNGELLWDYVLVNSTRSLNHDYEVLPNGNILLTILEIPTKNELVDNGCNVDSVDEFLRLSIVEVEPVFPNSANVVWEWDSWDHLIQDYNSSKRNYGAVQDHPELIDINYREENNQGGADNLHINAIDYNEDLDQILLSVRAFDEIWIIDHNTTTEESAGHTGGGYEMGGDLLYRWGNPLAYKCGSEEEHMIFKHHAARWIEKGCPGEGNIIFFNNGFCRPEKLYSNVLEIKPPTNDNGKYFLNSDSIFGPEQPEWEYNSEKSSRFYSERFSSAQRLANGDTLICLGEPGKILLVNSENKVIWRYKNAFPHPLYDDIFLINYYDKDYLGIGDLNLRDKPLICFLNNHPFLFPLFRIFITESND